MAIRTFIFFTLLLCKSPSLPEKKTLKISSDSRPLIHLGKFAFTPGGQLSVAVSDVSFTSSVPDPSLLGFFIFSNKDIIHASYQDFQIPEYRNPNFNSTGCLLSCPFVVRLFTFHDLFNSSSYNNSFTVSTPDTYSLFFANCAAPDTTRVSFAIRTEMFNYLPDGSRDYLTLGLSPVPTLYSLFALVYVAFFAAWAFLCQRLKKNRSRIHFLMGGLLLTKALNLAFTAENLHYARLTGSPLHGSGVLIYILQTLKGILLFTVLILIIAGWSFIKPFLHNHEKALIMLVIIPLQVFANLTTSTVLFLLSQFICCSVILPWLKCAADSLRRDAAKADGKAARNRTKFIFLKKLSIVVLLYLTISTFEIPMLKVIPAYKLQWVTLFVEEAMALAFDVFMFYTFRPKERDDYFVGGMDFVVLKYFRKIGISILSDKEEGEETAEAALHVEMV